MMTKVRHPSRVHDAWRAGAIARLAVTLGRSCGFPSDLPGGAFPVQAADVERDPFEEHAREVVEAGAKAIETLRTARR